MPVFVGDAPESDSFPFLRQNFDRFINNLHLSYVIARDYFCSEYIYRQTAPNAT